MGVFARMMRGLSEQGADPSTLMIDATYLKAHRTASSERVKLRKIRKRSGGSFS